MFRIAISRLGIAMRSLKLGQSSVRRLTTVANQASQPQPSAEELKRVVEFGRFIDDRLSLNMESKST